MSIGEKLYLGMVLATFFGFMILVMTLSLLSIRESRQDRTRAVGKPIGAERPSGKTAAQH